MMNDAEKREERFFKDLMTLCEAYWHNEPATIEAILGASEHGDLLATACGLLLAIARERVESGEAATVEDALDQWTIEMAG